MRRAKTMYLSCPICRKELAGTPKWQDIPTFAGGRGLDAHLREKHGGDRQ